MNIVEYESLHEQKSHFNKNFAYNTYLCSIPLDFKTVPLHWHDEAEFIYVKKGSGRIEVEFCSNRVFAGDIVFLPPGTVHSISCDAGEMMEYENIIFEPRLILGSGLDDIYEKSVIKIFNMELRLPFVFKYGDVGYSLLKLCLDECDELGKTFPFGYEAAIKGNLFRLCFQWLQIFTVADQKNESRAGQKSDKLKKVIKYVELNYSINVTIEDMALLTGFSQSHFMRFFRDAMGVSFVTYLNDYRLTMAARLLLASEDSVLSIAAAVGFDNLSHFNRCFKKKYGISPREYRKA